MGNVLLDFSPIHKDAGGINQVCRIFAARMAENGPHCYWAVWPGDASRTIVRLSTREDNLRRFDTYFERTKSGVSPNGAAGARPRSSCFASRNSWLCTSWRWAMVHRRRLAHQWDLYRRYLRDRHYVRRCAAIPADVIHCPYQWINPAPPNHAARTPYIMNLHDLQHEHFPQFFSSHELMLRRSLWYSSARSSRFVVVAARHVADDVVKYTGVCPDRVKVIPWGPFMEDAAPPTQHLGGEMKKAYDLPSRFLLYPAVTWPHKNHIELLKAMLKVNDGSRQVKLLLTGGRGAWADQVERFILENGLEAHVRHLGFIPYGHLKVLYTMAVGVVVPSLYEQSSGPVMEAMTLGCPIAAGRIADHAELAAKGCGLLFDPANSSDIARCIRTLWDQPDTCREMGARGQKRIHRIRNWNDCMTAYRDLYETCTRERRDLTSLEDTQRQKGEWRHVLCRSDEGRGS